jgi:hypothetical protein
VWSLREIEGNDNRRVQILIFTIATTDKGIKKKNTQHTLQSGRLGRLANLAEKQLIDCQCIA